MLAMSHIPLAQLAVMLAIIAALFLVLTSLFFGFLAIMLIFIIVAMTVTLCQRGIRAERQRNCGSQVKPFVRRHIFSSENVDPA